MRQPREKLPPSVGHPRRFSVPKGAATYGRMSTRPLAPIRDPFAIPPTTPRLRAPFTPEARSLMASHLPGAPCGFGATLHTSERPSCPGCQRVMAREYREQIA